MVEKEKPGGGLALPPPPSHDLPVGVDGDTTTPVTTSSSSSSSCPPSGSLLGIEGVRTLVHHLQNAIQAANVLLPTNTKPSLPSSSPPSKVSSGQRVLSVCLSGMTVLL